MLDGAGSEGREPRDDLRTLLSELRLYGHGLLEKPCLVFANKSDLAARPGVERRLRMAVKETGLELVSGSALVGGGLGSLANRLRELLDARKSNHTFQVSSPSGDSQ